MIRVATFNLNNIFDRFNFHATIPKHGKSSITYVWSATDDKASPVDDVAGEAYMVLDRKHVKIELGPSGRLIRQRADDDIAALHKRIDLLNADVLAVQEVENIFALKEFNKSLRNPYPYRVLLEGNDPRFIDVGLLSRLPIGAAISHRWEPDPKNTDKFLFSRDLLAVEILNHTRTATLFTIWVTHLKSKFIDPAIRDPQKRKAVEKANDARRKAQATAIRDLMAAHHNTAQDAFILCGDMNDHPTNATLRPLQAKKLKLRDVFHAGAKMISEDGNSGPRINNPEDKPANDDWTHRLSVSHAPDVYERFDQIFLSQQLQAAQQDAAIQRRTHWSKKKAGSDHDPVWVDLNLQP